MVPSYDSRLHRILSEEGRKQNWLAERAGMDRRRMHLIVHGIRPSEDEAQAIAETLGRSVEELFPEHEAAV